MLAAKAQVEATDEAEARKKQLADADHWWMTYRPPTRVDWTKSFASLVGSICLLFMLYRLSGVAV
jgi:hypothetical protein